MLNSLGQDNDDDFNDWDESKALAKPEEKKVEEDPVIQTADSIMEPAQIEQQQPGSQDKT